MKLRAVLLPAFSILLSATCQADVLVGFNPQGFTMGGPSPWDETSAPNTITRHEGVELTSGLQRGEGITSGGTAEAWGGSGWEGTDRDSAIGDADYFTVTIAPTKGKAISFDQIQSLIFRGDNSATTYLWQYQIGDGPFVDIGTPVTVSASTVKGTPQEPTALSGIKELQDISQPVTFRMLGWGAASKGASWGFGKTSGAEVLTFEGTIQ